MKHALWSLTLCVVAVVSPEVRAQEQKTADPAALAPASTVKGSEQVPQEAAGTGGADGSSATAVAQVTAAEAKSPNQGAGLGSQPVSPAAAQQTAPPASSSLKLGSVSVTPYGTIVGSAHWNASGFGSAPCPNPCETAESARGATQTDYASFANGMPGAFIMSSRLSRFGANLQFPTDGLEGFTLKGQVEIDFGGGFTSSGNSLAWYVPVPRLRLANTTLKWQFSDAASVSILGGLAPGLIAPLFGIRPILHTPIFFYAGNLWRRSPQFRVFGEVGGDLAFTWGAAMLSPITNLADSATTQVINTDFGPGNRSRMPDFEARLGFLYKKEKKTVADVGVSTHLGRERYFTSAGTDQDVDSFAVALDANLSVGIFGLRGELFTGHNMDNANGNFPGASPSGGIRFVRAATSGPPDEVAPISTRGGWAQLAITPVQQLHFLGGYGFEDPNDADLANPTLAPTTKLRNQQIYAGLIVTPTKAWFLGLDVIRTTTLYAGEVSDGKGPRLTADQLTLATGASF